MRGRTGRALRGVVGIGAALIVAAMGMTPNPAGGLEAGSTATSVEPTETDAAGEAGRTRLLLHREHVDMLAPEYHDGELVMRTEVDLDSGRGQRFDPDELVFQLQDGPKSQMTVPGDDSYAFLGPAGTPFLIAWDYHIGEMIWPGWNTQSPTLVGQFDPDTIDIRFMGAEGPGPVEVFAIGGFGTASRLFSSEDPAFTDVTTMMGTHVHANWAFYEHGEYTLTFQITATTVDGVEVTTGPVDFDWVVGPHPTDLHLAADPAEPVVGDDVELVATVTTAAVPERGALPTGTVVFRSGDDVMGDAPVIEGTARVTIPEVDEGIGELTAEYTPGDEVADLYGASSSVATVEPAPDPGNGDNDNDNGNGGGGNGGGNGGGDVECPIEVVLDVGHVDVAARVVDGRLRTQVKDGTQPGPEVWRDLETVAFHVKPEAHAQLPPGGMFDFIGPEGSDVWLIPQTQDHDLIWAGWNTEYVDYSQLDGGIDWSLDAVRGPGEMVIYQVAGFGSVLVHFTSHEDLPQVLDLPWRTHAHGTWAFTAEGIYELEMGHRATSASGEDLEDTGMLTVAVGDVDMDDLCPEADPPPPPGGRDPGGRDPGGRDPGGRDPDNRPDPPGTAPPAPRPPAPSTTAPRVPCPSPRATTTTVPAASDTGAPGGARRQGQAVVLDVGHVDYGARVVDGRLVSQIKDDTEPGSLTWRDPADVVLHLKPAAAIDVPSAPAFSFLGRPGATIWQIPQTQDADLLWLGWNTEEIGTDEVSGPVTWTLERMEGPGEFALYDFDAFGQPNVLFDSVAGTDTYTIPLGTHAHGNWAFTEEGTYRLRFTHRATLASGEVVSATETLTFAVGDVNPSPVRMAAPTRTTVEDTTTTAAAPGDCPPLPRTGSTIWPMVRAGVLLTLLGAALTYLARRWRNLKVQVLGA